MKGFRDLLRRDWRRYSVEVLVIIVGVSLSFALDGWRVRRQDARFEVEALESVRAGLVQDAEAIGAEIDLLVDFGAAFGYLLETTSTEGADIATLRNAIRAFGMYTYVERNDVAFEQLKATGQLRRIRNDALLSQIMKLYTGTYETSAEYAAIDKRYVLEDHIPLLREVVDMRTVRGDVGLAPHEPEQIQRLLDHQLFLSSVVVNRRFKEINIGIYRQILEQIDALTAAIDEELDR